MDSERQKILEAVVKAGLHKAQQRHVSPPVVQALISLNWSEAKIAQYLGLTLGRVSQWSTGTTHIPGRHLAALYHLLDQTLQAYETRIEALKEQDEWSMGAACRMRYPLGNAKGTLHRRRKVRPREAA